MSAPGPRWPLGLPTRLRPVRVIGGTGSTVVWQVRDTDAGRDLAVKVVRSLGERGGGGTDPARRAETEGRASARLADVDGVVHVLELGRTTTGDAWLALDLAPGGTLASRAPMPTRVLAPIGAQLAATLARAHERDVCHGDVSPANVLFDADGRPVLGDFGMAGLGFAPDDPGGLTPAFAAPERLRGAVPTPAADVFSLAATLAAVHDGTESDTAWAAVIARARADEPSQRPSAARLADALGAVRPH